MAQRWRPDLVVHLVLENAGSMRPQHRQAIAQALGIPGEWMVSLDSADWTACWRRRLYAATFPPAAGTQPARRPAPWHPDWIRLLAGPVEAFTRSRRRREEAHIRTST